MAISFTDDEARCRLDAILHDRLLRFNPYRVSDKELLDCAERGRWSPFPSITQMMVFHFHDIRSVRRTRCGEYDYDAIFFHIGNSCEEYHFSLMSLTRPMTNTITRKPEWTLVNGRHLVASNIRRLVGRSAFVSHGIKCERMGGSYRQAYRMHLLLGPESRRADIVRRAMCDAKLAMLQEVLLYPYHPDYLGKEVVSFDYVTPIRQAIENIRNYPSAIVPANHSGNQPEVEFGD